VDSHQLASPVKLSARQLPDCEYRDTELFVKGFALDFAFDSNEPAKLAIDTTALPGP
jgi:hypothetical protein